MSLTDAVADGVVPSAAIVAGDATSIRLRESVGFRQTVPTRLPVTPLTVFDLASLTKALATSVLTMRAITAGQLSLDEPLGARPPGASPTTAGAITVRRALAHATGHPAHLPLWTGLLGPGGAGASQPDVRAAVVEAAATAALAYEPGTRSLYSDLGMILLGDLLERRLGARLDQLLARLPPPYGTPALGYRPISLAVAPGQPLAEDVAATTACPVRGRIAHGEVDDCNAFAMGGVSGHAGLFGTADAVAAVAQALLAAYHGKGGATPLVDRDVLRTFWTPAGIPGSNWRLGWDGPAAENSLAGDRLARTAVGHLAFTGCSLWLDPEREIFVVLLTNRTHPEAHADPRFRALRRRSNDLALELLGYQA